MPDVGIRLHSQNQGGPGESLYSDSGVRIIQLRQVIEVLANVAADELVTGNLAFRLEALALTGHLGAVFLGARKSGDSEAEWKAERHTGQRLVAFLGVS